MLFQLFSPRALYFLCPPQLTTTVTPLQPTKISAHDGRTTLDPQLSWSGSIGEAIGFGANFDLNSNSKSIYAEAETGIPGGSIETNLEYSEGKYDYQDANARGVYLSVRASNNNKNAFAWFSDAWCPSESRPLKIGAKKIFSVGKDAKIMVKPRYAFDTSTPDVCLGVEKADTRLYLTVSPEDQNLLVSSKIRNAVEAAVKVGRKEGFMSASLEKPVGHFGVSKLTMQSDDVELLVNKDGWKARVSLSKPFLNSEPTLSFSKTFSA